jgi:hypothetical protein
VPDRLVSMFFSDGFGILNFYGLMLEHFVNSDPLALHWSIQPGVSDGCLELFSKQEAAVDHIEVVGRHWLGVGGPLLAMVQLQIRADRLYEFIQRGMMAFEGGKLKVFAQLVSGSELYSFIASHHGSVPAYISTPPPADRSRAGDWRLFGGFLKACVDCVDWSMKGLHWSMQPGAFGRITLYADPHHITEKYAYCQKPTSGTGPEIVQVVLFISEQAAARIMSSGVLVQGRSHGTFYMHVNMYDAVYFDQQQQELAYTSTVYTV